MLDKGTRSSMNLMYVEYSNSIAGKTESEKYFNYLITVTL